MIIKKLLLRGATGLLDGLGVEEVEVDFDRLSPGVIAIVGPNGSGKTTLVENMVPFPSLKSRPGSLANHFFLKDSRRDLTIDHQGAEWRFLLNIDGANKTGTVKTFAFKNGEPLNPDGNRDDYNRIVADLLGDEELFFRSVFAAQNSGSLYRLAPTERKRLVLELVGQQRIQGLCALAETKGGDTAQEIADWTTDAERLQASIESLGDLDATITTETETVEKQTGEKARLGEQVRAKARTIEEISTRSSAQSGAKTRIDQINERLGSISSEKVQIANDRDHDTFLIDEGATAARNAIAGVEAVKASLSELREKRARLAAIDSQVGSLTELRDKHVKADQLEKNRKGQKATAFGDYLRTLSTLEGDLTRGRTEVNILSSVPCQTGQDDANDPVEFEWFMQYCQDCRFIRDAKGTEGQLSKMETAVIDHKAQWIADERFHDEIIQEAEEALAAVGFAGQKEKDLGDIRQERKVLLDANPNLETEISGLETSIAKTAEHQGTVAAAEQRKADRQATADRDNDKLTAEKRGLQTERGELVHKYDVKIDDLLENERAALLLLETALSDAVDALAEAKARLEAAQVNETKYRDAKEQIRNLGAQISGAQIDLADWRDLSGGLSKKGGFQSLLIESAGAQITPFANDLLAEFGLPWTIQISTLRPKADGKGQTEGFFVYINTPDGSRELSDLSGGQEVWIEAVIFQAIAFLIQQSGRPIRTAIRDEADGALDQDMAMAYLRAIRAGHRLAGLDKTFLISHRPEIQKAVDQRLRLVRGTGIVIEGGN